MRVFEGGWRSPAHLAQLWRTRTGTVVLTSVGNLLVRTLSSVVLTRLLSPTDFGIVGIIGAVFFAFSMITDLGFEAFVVPHKRGDDRHFRDVVWTIHAVRGVVLAISSACLAPLIAWALGKPPLALPLAVASATFLINGTASLSLLTALRHDGARKLSALDFMAQAFQTIACISLALWWRNAWALVAAMLLQSLMRSTLSYLLFDESQQRPSRDRQISIEFLTFSKVILISSSITLVIMQMDKIVLARIFSLSEFGLYAIALNLAVAPTSLGDSYVNKVVFPVYAQIVQNVPTQIKHVYYKVRRSASLFYGFVCGGIIGGAHLLVWILYDPRYATAATWLSLLSISVALRLPNYAAAQLMTAQGDVRKVLTANMVRLGWLVLTVPAAFFQFGPVGVVASVGLLEVPAMFYNWLLLRRLGVFDLREEALYLAIVGLGAVLGYCSWIGLARLVGL